jgi:hypothetical protein
VAGRLRNVLRDSVGSTFYVDEGGKEWMVAITSWGEVMCWALQRDLIDRE